ncbi:MAG: glycosyltransferase [Psychromonas sp.]
MKYSIVVPHYNDLGGLRVLLKSIPSRVDIEIVVVDDNSNINKKDLSDMISISTCQNVKLFFNVNKPKSAGSCRNIGLENVSGKYILFGDADDYFTEGAFDKLDYATSTRPNNDIYFYKPISISLKDGSVSDRHVPFSNLVDEYLTGANENIRHGYGVPWSKVYSAKYLEEACFRFDEVIASNDIMFSLKTGWLAKNIQVIDEVIYCVTKGTNTLTVNRTKENQQSRILVSINASKYAVDNKIPTHKASALVLLRNNWSALDFNIFKYVLRGYLKGHLSFFPHIYMLYIKNPKRLLERFKK